MSRISETKTENIFRVIYGPTTFIEKSGIPNEMGFRSKKISTRMSGETISRLPEVTSALSNEKGYPNFVLDSFQQFTIIVEAKSTNQNQAIEDTKHYMLHNAINKDVIGTAFSGQSESFLRVNYFIK
jgi:hypothetical protein|eukprot:SAG22_NODE_2_length_61565_cov_858.782010_52_plen_127_part_00